MNIIEYKAKNPAAHYPYENGGGWKAAQELEEFFKANPDRTKSQHTLVIMPTWKMCIRDRPKVLPVRVNGKMTRMKTLPLKPGAEAPQAAAR